MQVYRPLTQFMWKFPLVQAATFAQLLSQNDACSVLQRAFLGIYTFCKGAEAIQVKPDAVATYGRLNSDLKGEHQMHLTMTSPLCLVSRDILSVRVHHHSLVDLDKFPDTKIGRARLSEGPL